MSKKRLLALALLSLLVASTQFGVHHTNIAEAQATGWGDIPPPEDIVYPVIKIFAPVNSTLYSSTVLLNLNVTPPTSKTAFFIFTEITYKADWKDQRVSIGHTTTDEFTFYDYLTGIPDGNHSINVTCICNGQVWANEPIIFYTFGLIVSQTVTFSVDSTPPSISSLSVENKTFNTNTVLLSFFVSKPSALTYSLDGQQNVSIAGNTTLTGLSDGSHSLIVYADDLAGNIVHSDLSNFTVNTATPSPVVTSSPTTFPTAEPTSTPKQPSGFLGTNLPLEYGYAIVAVLVIIIVAGLSLVCLKKLGKQKVNS